MKLQSKKGKVLNFSAKHKLTDKILREGRRYPVEINAQSLRKFKKSYKIEAIFQAPNRKGVFSSTVFRLSKMRSSFLQKFARIQIIPRKCQGGSFKLVQGGYTAALDSFLFFSLLRVSSDSIEAYEIISLQLGMVLRVSGIRYCHSYHTFFLDVSKKWNSQT